MKQNDQTDKIKDIKKWLIEKNIADVEILVSDFAGISRGKIMSSGKFIDGLTSRGHRVPEALFGLTINCAFSYNDYITELEEDLFMLPDVDTVRIVPWHTAPTACVICDPTRDNGTPSGLAPRQVLKKVLSLYHERGWQPVVAPEFEFFLVAKQDKIESPPIPPRGRSGKIAWDTGELSIDGLEEFNDYFNDVYQYCETMQVQLHTLTHEAGPAQFELNIAHGNPLHVADQSFLFKRIIKQTAIRHDMFATFIAKPYPEQYGSAMHIHQSVTDKKTGKNIFADSKGADTKLFLSHIAGLQKYLPSLMPLLAPYTNSYLRVSDRIDAPVNTHWGRENRSVGLRVPTSDPAGRRVENRIPGADVNPYLAIAASLIAGYLGMISDLEPTDPLLTSAYDLDSQRLPSHLFFSMKEMEQCEEIFKYLGEEFVSTYLSVKQMEYEASMNALSPWEIRYLLLNV